MLHVNGEKVEEREIEQEMERYRADHDRVFADKSPEEREAQLREWSRENVIERVLLRQAAEREGAPVPPEAVEERYRDLARRHGGEERLEEAMGLSAERIEEDIARELRVEHFMEEIVGPAPEPPEEEVRRRYEEHADRYALPAMVRASHIVKRIAGPLPPSEIRKKMRKILKRLEDGADFEAAVATHSDCPEQGGDLGFFPRGQMVKEFEDVVFSLKVGQLSDVFRTDFGYHIAKVTGRRPRRTATFEEAREAVVKELKDLARQKVFEDFIDREKAKAVIEDR